MSASSKKKLRKEQNAAQVTERQRRQQAEARKTKIYTVVFVTAMSLVLCVALLVLGVRFVNRTGVLQRNTIAATVGNRELNTVQMSYFYTDAIDKFYSDMYDQYAEYTDMYLNILYQLNPTKSLNSQVQNKETGATWADYFVEKAINDAKFYYTMYDKAIAENYTLPEDERKELEGSISVIEDISELYGYKNVSAYLQASYGYGADDKTYYDYLNLTALAKSYCNAYSDSLEYSDKDITDHEKEHASDYNSYKYASYALVYTKFLEGGTENEDGTTTYTDEQKDAARAKMKAIAEQLATAKTVEELDAMISALDINKDSKEPVVSTKTVRTLGSKITENIAKWLGEEGRKVGDIDAIPYYTTIENEDGTTTSTEDGYYIVALQDVDKNDKRMDRVRHLLVKFTGGTTDEDGNTVYSDASKNKAKESATNYLNTWKSGAATEESFIELVKKHSDDGSASIGGLFENIHADSSYVENFLNWSIDDARQVGDTEVIETEYGYHVMYYCGETEQTYRENMITETLRGEDYNKWVEENTKDVPAAKVDTSRLKLNRIISTGSY